MAKLLTSNAVFHGIGNGSFETMVTGMSSSLQQSSYPVVIFLLFFEVLQQVCYSEREFRFQHTGAEKLYLNMFIVKQAAVALRPTQVQRQ